MTHVRCYKSIIDEWNAKFPETNHADLISIAYRTSLLRAESALRKPKKRKKLKNEFV